jgi:hypothetical protein
MIPVARVVNRLRYKVDVPSDGKDELIQDGTSYTVTLSNKPIISGSEEVYLNHSTYTTGYNVLIPRNGTQTADYALSANIVYDINYNRGELRFFRGSGYVIGSGLNPFAPWNNSTVTAYYQYTKYTDKAMSDYVSYAVAGVESALHLGMYVEDVNLVRQPDPRNYTDLIDYIATERYLPTEKMIISEDLEIIQDLIARRASLDILSRERRIGAGNAIKLQDGDTMVDTAVGQKYITDLIRDWTEDYKDLLLWVIYNMTEGYTIKQIDERAGAFPSSGKYWSPGYQAVPSDF